MTSFEEYLKAKKEEEKYHATQPEKEESHPAP